ncbi:hypothetical protein AB6D11_06410 [Vibrio splendidus]
MSKCLPFLPTIIESLVQSKSPVAVYLINGVKLEGTITLQGRDAFELTKPSMPTQVVRFLSIASLVFSSKTNFRQVATHADEGDLVIAKFKEGIDADCWVTASLINGVRLSGMPMCGGSDGLLLERSTAKYTAYTFALTSQIASIQLNEPR